MSENEPHTPASGEWNVEAQGRAWNGDEAWSRYELTPHKIEMIDGKLFWSDETRLLMLGLLLENCGADAAVRFGNPEVWREAVARLGDEQATK